MEQETTHGDTDRDAPRTVPQLKKGRKERREAKLLQRGRARASAMGEEEDDCSLMGIGLNWCGVEEKEPLLGEKRGKFRAVGTRRIGPLRLALRVT